MKTGLKIFLGIVSLMALAVGITIYSFYNSISAEKILDNIYVNNTNLGNLSKDEAEAVLKSENAYKSIDLRYNEKSHMYSLTELGCKFEVEQAVNSAYEVGRSGEFIQDFSDYIKLEYLKDEKTFDVTNVVPQDIEEKLYQNIKTDIEKEPKDATITVGSAINVSKGENGVKIDREQFKTKLYDSIEPKKDVLVEVPIKEVEPNVKSEDLNKINGVIGSYKTTFSPHVHGRNENIRVSANYMDNTVLMPGEVFSYNQVTKLKTVKNGYKNATVIVNGEIEEGLGGGVCQTSSTLYNSVLYSGLEVIQRRPHSIPSNYVTYGRDAAVSDNSIDFKFKNNYNFPIVIKSYVGSSSITVSIYGNVESVPNIEIDSNVVSRKTREIKKVEDPTLPKGEEKIKTKGRDEVRSETYVIVDGVKKLVSKDKYPSQTKVILVGTKEEKKDQKETEKPQVSIE